MLNPSPHCRRLLALTIMSVRPTPSALLPATQGTLDDAEKLCKEVLETRRETLGDRHPSTLITMGNMGRLLSAQTRFSEAEALLKENLDACIEIGLSVCSAFVPTRVIHAALSRTILPSLRILISVCLHSKRLRLPGSVPISLAGGPSH